MRNFLIFTLIVYIQQLCARCDDMEITLSSDDQNIYTTHSESTRPVHVPVFERVPINVPHPIPYAVPQYIRVPIPQPYPHYTKIQHPIEVPVYKVIPEIIEIPAPYTVEKPFPIEVEKPFPIETIKKFEVPVPRPYPVHTIYYKHISEDDPAPAPQSSSSLTKCKHIAKPRILLGKLIYNDERSKRQTKKNLSKKSTKKSYDHRH